MTNHKYDLKSNNFGMSAETFYSEKSLRRKLFLLALAISVFSVWLITVTFQLLLINVAATFQVQVGTASLLVAVGSVAGIAAGLLTSVLSVRFNHKSLMLVGVLFTSLAAIGFFVAPTFSLVLLTNIGVGAGLAMTTPMAYSLIGEVYPLEKRGRAIGGIVASSTLAYVIGAPVAAIIASIGTWRLVMLWFVLPISVASLVLAFFVIPKKLNGNSVSEREPFLAGCKQVFSNRSAVASLFATMFGFAEATIAVYLVSFFRFQFSISIDLGAIVMVVGYLLSAVGGVVAGLFVNRVGRKPLGTITILVAALLTLSFAFMPTFELSWGLNALRFWFAGMSFTAGGSIVLEQVPKFRGTMMSLNSAFMNGGMLLAAIAGAIVLNLYNYQSVALVLGSLGLAGTVVWIFLVKDPCKTQKSI